LKRDYGWQQRAAPSGVGPACQADERQVTVGRVTGIFGVKGWVRVFSYTDPPENILQYVPWLIGESLGAPYRVTGGATHGRGVIAHLQGIDDRDIARRLIGSTIRIPRSLLGNPGLGAYFWFDLIGLEVVNEDGTSFGRVAELLETGANDVLVVSGDRRRLIPFVLRSVVKFVDFDRCIIGVSWYLDY